MINTKALQKPLGIKGTKKNILCSLIKEHLITSVMSISALFPTLYSCWFAVIVFFAHFNSLLSFWLKVLLYLKNDNVPLPCSFFMYFVHCAENYCNILSSFFLLSTPQLLSKGIILILLFVLHYFFITSIYYLNYFKALDVLAFSPQMHILWISMNMISGTDKIS